MKILAQQMYLGLEIYKIYQKKNWFSDPAWPSADSTLNGAYPHFQIYHVQFTLQSLTKSAT